MPQIFCGGGPVFVLTLIEDFSAEIGCRTVRADGEPAFQLHSVAIAPGELVFLPIKVGTVAVGQKEASEE